MLADVKVCVETEDCILARPVLEQKAYITVLPILKLKTGMCTMLRRMMVTICFMEKKLYRCRVEG